MNNRPFPAPLPEPPRIVSTRLTVPDLSISSDIESSCFKSKQRQIKSRNQRFEAQFQPKEVAEFTFPRRPLKTSPIIKRHVTKQSEVDVNDVLKKHDEQLQHISMQIEKLLQLTEKKPRPSMCSVETMTSNIWQSTNKVSQRTKKGSKGNSKLEQVREASIESMYDDVEYARGGEDGDDCYDHILSNIDEILRSSDSESNESLPIPAAGERNIRRNGRTGKGSAHEISSETLYIKRLASKYLVRESREPPVVTKETSTRPKSRRDLQIYGITHEVSSIATKNYLQKYGLVIKPQDFNLQGMKTARKGNRILDLESLKRQPKFV